MGTTRSGGSRHPAQLGVRALAGDRGRAPERGHDGAARAGGTSFVRAPARLGNARVCPCLFSYSGTKDRLYRAGIVCREASKEYLAYATRWAADAHTSFELFNHFATSITSWLTGEMWI